MLPSRASPRGRPARNGDAAMPGVILAFLERPDSAASLLAGAEHLAGKLGNVQIAVLAVRVPPEAGIVPGEEVVPVRVAVRRRLQEQERTAALHAVFAPWAARLEAGGRLVRWCETEASTEQALVEWGSRADVVVLSRPEEPSLLTSQAALHAVLFGTDRPVLVIPPGSSASFGRRVALAWRDERPATRAVLSALRSLVPPEKVFVLAGVRPGEPPPRLPDILAEHGIAAELHVLEDSHGVSGAELLEKAHALGADLLVMGAYRHSPVREFLLGGVTRHMLMHADLPVLMRH